jgi:hypothetical protein
VKKKQLKITMINRTARQIASQRRFTQEQLKQLDDLLRDQNHFLWSQLLPAL